MYWALQSFNLSQNETALKKENNPPDSNPIHHTYTFHLTSLYHLVWKTKPHVITIHLYAATLIGSNFGTLSTFNCIPFIFTDYYILENNSLLKAALKYKRIQLTDFRTVAMEHFGENKVLVSLLLLWIRDELMIHLLVFSSFSFDRFTFEDLLPTRLLWVTSLWTTDGGVCIML